MKELGLSNLGSSLLPIPVVVQLEVCSSRSGQEKGKFKGKRLVLDIGKECSLKNRKDVLFSFV